MSNWKIAFLARIDFLQGASTELLKRIARDVAEVAVSRGTEIFADGAAGDAMYFIVEGDVRIEKKGQLLLSRKDGEYIGEMALVDEAPRSATAVAGKDVLLLRWKKDAFRDTLAGEGRIAYQVCRAFCNKIREDVERVSNFQQDVGRAAQVQQAMLPETSYSSEILDLAACCLQTDRIGGDLYDYLPFADGQIALFIADAQGHGFSAALLIAMLKSRLHGQVLRDRDPSKVMAALNQTLVEHLGSTRLTTCFYIVLDAKNHTYQYCSAGHNPQYLVRAETSDLEELEASGIPLGVYQSNTAYRAVSGTWQSGDVFVLYTDGVSEAQRLDEEELGKRRLREFIFQARHLEPQAMQERLLEGAREFRGEETFIDDVTLLIARMR